MALGDAYIDVHANTAPFRTDLQELAASSTGIDKDFEAQGKEFGNALHEGLRSTLNDGVSETRRGFRSRMSAAFSDVGQDFVSLFRGGLSSPGSIAALTALGFGLSPFIIDGLAAGIALLAGTGAIGLGAFILREKPEIQRAIKNLKFNIEAIFGAAAEPMLPPLLSGINKITEFIRNNIGSFVRIFTAAGALIDPLVDSILRLVQMALPGFTNMLEKSGPIFEALGHELPNIGLALGDIFNAIADSAPTIGIILRELLHAISLLLGFYAQLIRFTEFVFGGEAGQKIRDFFEHLIPSAVSQALASIVSFASQGIAWLSAFRDNAVGRIGDFLNRVRDIPGIILNSVSNFGSLLYNAGASLIQGLINGIASRVQQLRDWMRYLADTIARFLPGSPAKEGPLSGQGYAKFRGQHLVQDLVAGMTSEIPAVNSASNSTAQFLFGATNINFNGPVTEEAGRLAGNAAGGSILAMIGANTSRLAVRMA